MSQAKVILVLVCSLFFTSCKYSKLVPEGEHLLHKNRVEGNNESASESELLEQVRFQPNRKILVIKAHMWVNYVGKRIGLKKIGEPPVLIDTSAIASSAESMQRYLVKKGYFDNEVSYRIDQTRLARTLKLRKQRVWYQVTEGQPYSIKKLTYHIDSDEISQLIANHHLEAKIQENTVVDFDKMGEERSRLSNLLKNNGYYYFNPSLIDFELDTSVGNHQANVDIFVRNIDSLEHVKQRIRRVIVVYNTEKTLNDTVRNEEYNISFVMNGMDISPAVIANNVLLKEGDYFSQENLETTYERLINLNLFGNVGVDIRDQEKRSLVDIVVYLKPSPKFDFVWQPQIITTEQRFNNAQSSRNLGVANEFTLKNKNVFHNGEELDFNVRTALEAQFTSDSSTAFSTFIQEVGTELRIPQLLFFRKKGNQLKINSVRTNFSASYLFEVNPFYRRNLFPLSYTYALADNNFSLSYSPLLISLNEATYKSTLFEQASPEYLQSLDRIFTNNLITSQRIGGFYSSKRKGDRRYWYVNSNLLEVAGVWLPQLTNYGERFGVNHSTFIRSDADVRYYIEFNDFNTLVLRAFAGIGVPIGSQSVLPYERRFTSGGSNYLRGWRLRTVGPGSFSAADNLQLTRTGEMGLLGNIEYRFNVLNGGVKFDGALFIDVGNVWNLKADTLFPNGEFSFDRFTEEFAVNSGLGFRFDLSFLLLRADLGIPIWDPNFALEERAVIRKALQDRWLLRRPVWNVAIGYPF